MIGASKILTVSYGTFSCTLEGFEEPFSTMKAIAEYFRDLAADDRYFGAEPPTPDAEMLHRIAEREIQRRVEAKINENGVVLRADAMPVADAGMVNGAGPAKLGAAAPVQKDAVAEATAMAPAPSVTVAAVAPAPAAIGVDGNAAARLSRLRAAVEQARNAGLASVRAVPIYAEDVYTEDLLADAAPVGVATPVAEPMDVPGEMGSPAMAPVAEETLANAGTAVAPDYVPQDYAAQDQASEDVAAEILPSDPAAGFADSAAWSDVSDEYPDEALVLDMGNEADDLAWIAGAAASGAEPEITASELLASADAIAAEAGQDAAPLVAADEEAFVEDTGDETSLTAPGNLFVDAADAMPPEDVALPAKDMAARVLSDVRSVNQEDDFTLALLARITAEAGAETVAEAEPEMVAEAEPVMVAEAAPDADWLADVEPYPLQTSDDLTTAGGEASARPRARVIKVRRAEWLESGDVPAATVGEAQPFDSQPFETEADDPVLQGIKASLGKAGLSMEGQDDLVNELADVAREMAEPEAALPIDVAEDLAGEEDWADAETEAAKEMALELTPETTSEDLAEDMPVAAILDEEAGQDQRPIEGRFNPEIAKEPQEDAISRLFNQTNTELEGTENRRRLSAIAHLKAAVAANEAEKEIHPEGLAARDSSDMDRYRDDLAQVVRPRRPEVTGVQSRRPVTIKDRPAPLVLVSEQRIDRPAQSGEASLVRPRRVMTSALAMDDDLLDDEDEDLLLTAEEQGSILADSKSFAEFAERIGARDLVDLLEAAAAYAATVEGRSSFSRPQIMKRVQTMSDDDQFSREEGLRSFGMLLRQGKIQKVRRGQFAIAKTSRYIDEARRIGS